MKLEFLPEAERDIERIGDYIARDNPHRALTFIREIRARCRKIALAPKACRERPELGEGVRAYPHGNFVIFYLEDEKRLRIIRVLHGAIDIAARFIEESYPSRPISHCH